MRCGPRVSVEQAAVIIRELVKTGPGCSLDDRAMGERVLIEHAPGLTVEQLRRLAVQVRDRLDQDGTEPREADAASAPVVDDHHHPDGMTHIDWYLDAESAGHVLPQITAYVSQDYRASHASVRTRPARPDTCDHAGGPSSPVSGCQATSRSWPPRISAGVAARAGSPDGSADPSADMPESRSLAQLRSDGAVEVFRHRAGCSPRSTQSAGDDDRPDQRWLTCAAGTAPREIDEIPTPVSAGTARRLAADAESHPDGARREQ